MNFKAAILAVFGSALLSTGLKAQEIPGGSLNPNGPFYPDGNVFTPGSANTTRQFNADYWQNSINTYYGIIMPGSYSSAMKTITHFETSIDDLLVYPNPTWSIANVRLHEPAPVVAFVFIIDMNGNIVRAMQFPSGSLFLEVNMGDLPRGTYSVRVFGPYISFHNMTVLKTGDT